MPCSGQLRPNADDKLFRCGNEECMRVSCRKCQKACMQTRCTGAADDLTQVDHLPKSCEEYADDLKKNNIHKVEEAMSEAFIRKCPKCKRPFMKEYGVSRYLRCKRS